MSVVPPLGLGDCANAARVALDQLSFSLIALPASKITTSSLGFGWSGLAVAHAHLTYFFPERDHRACARAALDRAASRLTEEVSAPSLFSGFTGVAWAFAHVQSLEGFAPSSAQVDPLADMDDALLAASSTPSWNDEFDLLDGLVGVAIYWLERLPRSAAVAGLEHVVRLLDQLAVPRGDAIAWADIDEPECFNVGVAHGTPGVIPVLAAIMASVVRAPAAPRLLHGAVRWVERQRRADDAQFPISVGGSARPARCGWCHGAPGISAALLVASRAAGEPRWQSLAIDIARRASQRPFASSGVKDAGLCHGAAGLGHIYHRIHAETGERFAADAARDWFSRALALRDPGRGIGGFLSVWHGDDGDSLVADPGLLMGAAGVALGLAAALGGRSPSWDRAFALSAL